MFSRTHSLVLVASWPASEEQTVSTKNYVSVYKISDDYTMSQAIYFATLKEAREAASFEAKDDVMGQDVEIERLLVGPMNRDGVVNMLNHENFAAKTVIVGVMRPVWCENCDNCRSRDEVCERVSVKWVPAATS